MASSAATGIDAGEHARRGDGKQRGYRDRRGGARAARRWQAARPQPEEQPQREEQTQWWDSHNLEGFVSIVFVEERVIRWDAKFFLLRPTSSGMIRWVVTGGGLRGRRWRIDWRIWASITGGHI